MNFHGIRIVGKNLPIICSMDSRWNVKADVLDCAELKLVLPARKEIVETPFLSRLKKACRMAIYHAMLKVNAETDEQINVPVDVHTDALTHGIELPVARAELARWWPRYVNEYSTKAGSARRVALPDKPIVVEADIPPCDQVALWRAANRAGIAQRLCAEESRYRGYPWYDSLAKAKKLTTSVVIDGEELSIESERDKDVPLDTARPEQITFVLETVDGEGAIDHVRIPADVAFGDADVGWVEDVSVLVTKNSNITPNELADLMNDAFFSPSDDIESDSYETQEENYLQASEAMALELLVSPREAMLSNLRTAIQRWCMPHLPRETTAIIRISTDRTIDISIERIDANP